MFRILAGFFTGMTTLAKPWRFWVAALVVVNGVMPFLFLGLIEARIVLLAFALAAVLQLAIFRYLGFGRLLGLGHIVVWVPMLAWLGTRFRLYSADTVVGGWLLAVIVLDGVSLVIDFVDVGRYLAGEREPSHRLGADS